MNIKELSKYQKRVLHEYETHIPTAMDEQKELYELAKACPEDELEIRLYKRYIEKQRAIHGKSSWEKGVYEYVLRKHGLINEALNEIRESKTRSGLFEAACGETPKLNSEEVSAW